MTTNPPGREATARPGALDRALAVVTDVRPGEGVEALLLLANVFLILVCYYVLKTVREPLILTSEVPAFLRALGVEKAAEVKSYAAAVQALLLMVFVPLYSMVAARLDRLKLVIGLSFFFVANILLFAVGVTAGAPYLGIAFFIWVGLFSVTLIAQFWSYANDLYTKEEGKRLFPLIGIGMTAGSPLGAWLAKSMFKAGLSPATMLGVAACLLTLSAALYWVASLRAPRGESHHAEDAKEPIGGKGGFALVFATRYTGLIAILLVLLNVVNTTGEFILGDLVVKRADELAASAAPAPASRVATEAAPAPAPSASPAASPGSAPAPASAGAPAAPGATPGFDKKAYIGAFYGDYFFWVNIGAVLLQMFVASRLVKRAGLGGVLFALPFVALGAYGVVALGATLSIVRWMKTAENATDYSLMNTARQLLWLPTSREEKYKAKQAVDGFFVRLGDVVSALFVFGGTTLLSLEARGFAIVNLCVVVVWLLLAGMLVRENHKLMEQGAGKAE